MHLLPRPYQSQSTPQSIGDYVFMFRQCFAPADEEGDYYVSHFDQLRVNSVSALCCPGIHGFRNLFFLVELTAVVLWSC